MASEQNGDHGVSSIKIEDETKVQENGVEAETKSNPDDKELESLSSFIDVEGILSEALRTNTLSAEAARWYENLLDDDDRATIERGINATIQKGCRKASQRSYETVVLQQKANKQATRKDTKSSHHKHAKREKQPTRQYDFNHGTNHKYCGGGGPIHNNFHTVLYNDPWHGRRYENNYEEYIVPRDEIPHYERNHLQSRNYDYERMDDRRGDSRSRSYRVDEWRRGHSRSMTPEGSRRVSRRHDDHRGTHSRSSSVGPCRSQSTEAIGKDSEDGVPNEISRHKLGIAHGTDTKPSSTDDAIDEERRSRRRSEKDRSKGSDSRGSRDARSHSSENRRTRSRSRERRSRRDRDRSYDRHDRDRRRRHDDRKHKDERDHDRKSSRYDDRDRSPSSSPDVKRAAKDDDNSSSRRRRDRSGRKSEKRRRDDKDRPTGGGSQGRKRSRSRRRRRSKDGESRADRDRPSTHSSNEVKGASADDDAIPAL